MPAENRSNPDRASVNINLLSVSLKPPINGFSDSLEPYWHGEQNDAPRKKNELDAIKANNSAVLRTRAYNEQMAPSGP